MEPEKPQYVRDLDECLAKLPGDVDRARAYSALSCLVSSIARKAMTSTFAREDIGKRAEVGITELEQYFCDQAKTKAERRAEK